MDTCKQMKVPCSIEFSRSGRIAHVWIFFSENIPATTARKLGITIKILLQDGFNIRGKAKYGGLIQDRQYLQFPYEFF